ncbi:MAG: hypothetical protein FJ098_03000, partial [Deltaproteobacteria bacterium]|nr:hypothetical protein [Deltaproteobacteria bacterium]
MDPTLQSPPRLLSDVFFPIGSAPDEDYFDLLPPLAKDLTPGEAPQDGKGVETGTGTGPGPGPGIWSPLGLPQILEPGSEVAVDPVLLQRAKIQLAARLTMAVQSARESPLGLYQLIFADSQGNDITIGWHHREWNEALLKFRNVMIEAARGSSKTTFLICACLWIIGRNPNIRIKWVGPNEGNVQKRLQFIRSVILQNKLYQLTFPNVRQARDRRLPNNANFLTLERTTFSTEPTIEAKGVLSTGTGDRSDILLGDDLCTEKNTILEPATREKIKHSVLNDWLPTVDPKYGRVWLIFTPWSEEDVNAYLKKVVGSQWFYKKYAHGRPGDPCHSFFPELWPRKALEERLRWLGRVHYSRAYLCMAVSADQVAVNPKDLQPYSQVHIQKRNVDRSFCLISVDPASGKNLQKSSDLDFCGFTVFLFLPPEEKPKEHNEREAHNEDTDA